MKVAANYSKTHVDHYHFSPAAVDEDVKIMIQRAERGPGEEEARMKDKTVRLGPREKQITELLLQGCDNAEIAKQLRMARRTVKAHFNRLFLRFGITSGIKRVKLATLLYRREICSNPNATETASQAPENEKSSNWSRKDSRTAKLRMPSASRNMSSKTISESSTTSLGSGTVSSSRSGTKLDGMKVRSSGPAMESWELRLLNLDGSAESGSAD